MKKSFRRSGLRSSYNTRSSSDAVPSYFALPHSSLFCVQVAGSESLHILIKKAIIPIGIPKNDKKLGFPKNEVILHTVGKSHFLMESQFLTKGCCRKPNPLWEA